MVGDSSLNCCKRSDRPESFWECPIPSDVQGEKRESLSVTVQLGLNKVTLNLATDQQEICWTCNDGLFG